MVHAELGNVAVVNVLIEASAFLDGQDKVSIIICGCIYAKRGNSMQSLSSRLLDKMISIHNTNSFFSQCTEPSLL